MTGHYETAVTIRSPYLLDSGATHEETRRTTKEERGGTLLFKMQSRTVGGMVSNVSSCTLICLTGYFQYYRQRDPVVFAQRLQPYPWGLQTILYCALFDRKREERSTRFLVTCCTKKVVKDAHFFPPHPSTTRCSRTLPCANRNLQ